MLTKQKVESTCNSVSHTQTHTPICTVYTSHSDLTGKLTKCVQYGINDLYLYRPGFYVPDISGSSCTVHKFVQVVTYRTLAK